MKYENEFYNKNIVITGASSGIGLSAAFYFLNSNAKLILACQDVASMENICKQNHFSNAAIIKTDLEKKEQIEKLLAYITKLFPSIDILINCAGIKLDCDIEKSYEEDFKYTVNVNLRSIFLMLKELRPYFSQEASVINLSCLYGTRPMCGVISYAMSKAGLETLTRYAAAEFANLNIRINAISACPVNTNSFRYIKVSEEEIDYFNKKMEKNIPLGRIAEADDIVKVIIFLASKRSSKITGQIIKVDGGRSLTSSGYLHYKGIQNMNVKFEPDSVNIKNYLKNIFQKEQKVLEKPITDKEKLKKFIDETITQSNYTTRDTEAHRTIISNYYKVRETDSTLTNRYLKGSVPNTLLLEKKGETFSPMSYNPNQIPFNILNGLDKNSIYNQADKGNYEDNNNNFKSRKIKNEDNRDVNNNINNEEIKEEINEDNKEELYNEKKGEIKEGLDEEIRMNDEENREEKEKEDNDRENNKNEEEKEQESNKDERGKENEQNEDGNEKEKEIEEEIRNENHGMEEKNEL
jgi:NAD(P)-dependent dehydrogenase (short-subunit alcohol dehydrogenase family)